MAQLVVRNLPDEVKERLQRRAEKHGRSLEAEVRSILSQVPEAPSIRGRKIGAGTLLARKLAKLKVTDADWEAFDQNIKDLRRNWRVRDIDFGT